MYFSHETMRVGQKIEGSEGAGSSVYACIEKTNWNKLQFSGLKKWQETNSISELEN